MQRRSFVVRAVHVFYGCDLRLCLGIYEMISVVICTFNRAASLRRTLNSFVELRPPVHSDWELLVVDNNSSDHTKEAVSSFEFRLPLRYVFEAEQGLSAARNRALKEFTGDLLLFTDDDVVVDPNWLVAFDAAAKRFPLAGYFGGRVLPFWSDRKPSWLKDESLALISGLLVRFDLGDQTCEFAIGDPTPFGASFALRRSVIDTFGAFRKDLGVVGSVPGRGEESEYLERVRASGGVGVYVGDALISHWTDPNRLSLGYMYRYGLHTGVAAKTRGSPTRGSLLSVASFASRGVWQLLRGRGDRFRQCVINVGIQMALRRGGR